MGSFQRKKRPSERFVQFAWQASAMVGIARYGGNEVKVQLAEAVLPLDLALCFYSCKAAQ